MKTARAEFYGIKTGKSFMCKKHGGDLKRYKKDYCDYEKMISVYYAKRPIELPPIYFNGIPPEEAIDRVPFD